MYVNVGKTAGVVATEAGEAHRARKSADPGARQERARSAAGARQERGRSAPGARQERARSAGLGRVQENRTRRAKKPRADLARGSRNVHTVLAVAARCRDLLRRTLLPKRSTSLSARLLAGWEPAPLPAPSPDGLNPAGPPETLVALPPSLCEAGPCRHYHSVASVLDAERPLDGSATRLHEQTTRACYPSPGIEIDLTEAPVLRCSRWEPDQEQSAFMEELRADYLRSPAGQEFLASREAATDTTTGRNQ